MKENNEVASVLKDTKKLNESSRNTRERLAGIAFLALQSLDDRDGISDKYISEITALAAIGRNEVQLLKNLSEVLDEDLTLNELIINVFDKERFH